MTNKHYPIDLTLQAWHHSVAGWVIVPSRRLSNKRILGR